MQSPPADANASRLYRSRTSRRRFVTGLTAAASSLVSPIGSQARRATPSAATRSTGFADVEAFVEGVVRDTGGPGAVWLVSYRGAVEYGAIGVLDLETGEPMRRDSVFRIASVTKPIVAMAALTLVEGGEIGLDDPVDPWLPELADRQVVRTLRSPIDDTVPAERPITLRDILSFKMGLGWFFDPPGTYPLQEAFVESGIAFAPLPPAGEFMEILGGLPLASQPGEVWRYNTPMDVAGVLIERVTGGSLGNYLQEFVFSPLGMADTGFHVPEAKLDRFVTLYGRNPNTGEMEIRDPARGGVWVKPPAFESGGGGLVSTADDLLAFGRMLVNGSRHDDGQFLSDALFEEMTTNNLTLQQRSTGTFFPGLDAWGWGLGLGVITRESGLPRAGSVGWLGGTSTLLVCDPVEDMVAILLFQVDDLLWFRPVTNAFWSYVYPAIGAST